MSYASVAATNAPSPSQQPHADPALLNTTPPTHDNIADDAVKINIVSPDFKQDLQTYTSESSIVVDEDDHQLPSTSHSSTRARNRSVRRMKEVEAEGTYVWESVKKYFVRPGVAGGLLGIVNVGVLAGIGRVFYSQSHLRRDVTAVSSTIAAVMTLFTLEGYAAEQYRKTPRGQEEERRARKEGAVIYKHIREQLLRPGVLGGLVGFVNATVLGTLGYISYINWNRPSWDRRIVSTISVGLLTLWGGEGYLAERYRKKST
ncbi:hypothetical protein BDQ17DRAFT_1368020 [Cyathus striatus]|nr:hypothetical protein BDQ17DRAFT_1368020 [Cyathus striatus]